MASDAKIKSAIQFLVNYYERGTVPNADRQSALLEVWRHNFGGEEITDEILQSAVLAQTETDDKFLPNAGAVRKIAERLMAHKQYQIIESRNHTLTEKPRESDYDQAAIDAHISKLQSDYAEWCLKDKRYINGILERENITATQWQGLTRIKQLEYILQ